MSKTVSMSNQVREEKRRQEKGGIHSQGGEQAAHKKKTKKRNTSGKKKTGAVDGKNHKHNKWMMRRGAHVHEKKRKRAAKKYNKWLGKKNGSTANSNAETVRRERENAEGRN